MAKAWAERNRYAAWVERLKRSVEIRDGRIAALQAQLQQAIKRAEAAEGLAEVRLISGLWLWKVIAAALPFAKPIITPAEALAQRGEGDA